MPDRLIHKLVQPSPKGVQYLDDHILCWVGGFDRIGEEIRNVRVSTDVNDVTCVDCKGRWLEAKYSG